MNGQLENAVAGPSNPRSNDPQSSALSPSSSAAPHLPPLLFLPPSGLAHIQSFSTYAYQHITLQVLLSLQHISQVPKTFLAGSTFFPRTTNTSDPTPHQRTQIRCHQHLSHPLGLIKARGGRLLLRRAQLILRHPEVRMQMMTMVREAKETRRKRTTTSI